MNVLSSMDIIRKDKYNIMYNHFNKFITGDLDSDDDENDSGKTDENG